MSQKIALIDLGLVEYKNAWEYQEKLFENLIEKKRASKLTIENGDMPSGYLIICEHPNVYTVGKSGTENNLLINNQFLEKIKATYFRTNRGGDITYHGPGQIVAYPIFDLELFNMRIKQYIHTLEEAVILTLRDFKIDSERLDTASGVWIDTKTPAKTRKICAIGVRASRFVTMHGLALNVNTDLTYFNYINPCGFVDKGVTSMEIELNTKQPFEQIKTVLTSKLASVFDIKLISEKRAL